jgi:hypothetical protein
MQETSTSLFITSRDLRNLLKALRNLEQLKIIVIFDETLKSFVFQLLSFCKEIMELELIHGTLKFL